MQSEGWGICVEMRGQWPVCVKRGLRELDLDLKTKIRTMGIPTLSIPQVCARPDLLRQHELDNEAVTMTSEPALKENEDVDLSSRLPIENQQTSLRAKIEQHPEKNQVVVINIDDDPTPKLFQEVIDIDNDLEFNENHASVGVYRQASRVCRFGHGCEDGVGHQRRQRYHSQLRQSDTSGVPAS